MSGQEVPKYKGPYMVMMLSVPPDTPSAELRKRYETRDREVGDHFLTSDEASEVVGIPACVLRDWALVSGSIALVRHDENGECKLFPVLGVDGAWVCVDGNGNCTEILIPADSVGETFSLDFALVSLRLGTQATSEEIKERVARYCPGKTLLTAGEIAYVELILRDA